MKIVEQPPSSIYQITFKTRLGSLLPKKLSQETFCDPGGLVKALEKP